LNDEFKPGYFVPLRISEGIEVNISGDPETDPLRLADLLSRALRESAS
jgi:hypothetical protein